MTVDEEYVQRQTEYLRDLRESNDFHTKMEVMEEWNITEEEYEEMFGEETDEVDISNPE